MGLGFVQLTAIGVSWLAKTCVLRDLAFYLPVENTSHVHVSLVDREGGGLSYIIINNNTFNLYSAFLVPKAALHTIKSIWGHF